MAVEVKRSPLGGRGVFATATLPPGSLLVRALPAAAVLTSACLPTHCSVCLRPLPPPCPPASPAACAGCAVARLCGRCAHAEGPRRIHADECALLARLEATPPSERPAETATLRLLARLLLRRWREARRAEEQYVAADGAWWGEGDVLGDSYDDVLQLCQPAEEELPDGLGAAFADICRQVRFFVGAHARVGHEEVGALLRVLHCNSITLYDDAAHPHRSGSDGEIGVAISSSVAMFNASCEPSVCWRLDSDGCVCVETLRSVRRGEELTLCYVDPRLPAHTRRAKLREAYFFTCECRACVAEVSQWSCALCGSFNRAFSTQCAKRKCSGTQAHHAMPIGKRSRSRLATKETSTSPTGEN
ncbi:hypothetical protein AB1Y20_013425 [Prymnesium parvum]|uniref:SET domain-containing protein n=1 Tax=Prymnesium parvum TaxID=97485 RepID=A0AB34IF41_PRYPA